MRVYPAKGLQTRDPRTRAPIPAEGLEVEDTDLAIHRLLRDGDVTLEPPAAPSVPHEPVRAAEPASARSTEAGEKH